MAFLVEHSNICFSCNGSSVQHQFATREEVASYMVQMLDENSHLESSKDFTVYEIVAELDPTTFLAVPEKPVPPPEPYLMPTVTDLAKHTGRTGKVVAEALQELLRSGAVYPPSGVTVDDAIASLTLQIAAEEFI